MESDFINSRLKQPVRPTTSTNTTTTTQLTTHAISTTKAHDQNKDDTEDDEQDDDTVLIFSEKIDRNTKAPTASTHLQNAATRGSYDTLTHPD